MPGIIQTVGKIHEEPAGSSTGLLYSSSAAAKYVDFNIHRPHAARTSPRVGSSRPFLVQLTKAGATVKKANELVHLISGKVSQNRGGELDFQPSDSRDTWISYIYGGIWWLTSGFSGSM